MPDIIDMTGQRYGRLYIKERCYERDNSRQARWVCECDCGKVFIARSADIRNGKTKSCGCYAHDNFKKVVTKNGYCKNFPDTYTSYVHMLGRCYDEKNDGYKYYGAKGVDVQESWVESFANFLEDMGERPSKEYSLDRIDSSKGYTAENSQWILKGKNTTRMLNERHHYLKYLNKNSSVMPRKMTKGACAYDCFIPYDMPPLSPGEIRIIKLGFGLQPPAGYYVSIHARSGLASKGIIVANGIGLCDEDFTGEYGVILMNLSQAIQPLNKGDRICQLMLQKSISFEFMEVDTIEETERNPEGFGSSGGHDSLKGELTS